MSADENLAYGSVAVMLISRAGRLPETLTSTDFAVLAVVADFAGKDNRAWAAIATLAKAAHCSPTAARRSIHRLVQLGTLVELAPATRNTGVTYAVRLHGGGLPICQGYQSDSPTPPNAPAHPSQIDSPGLPICQGRATNLTAKPLRESLTEPTKEEGGERAGAHEDPPALVLRLWGEISKSAYGEKPAMGGPQERRYLASAQALLEAYGGDVDLVGEALYRCAQDPFRPDLHQIAKNPDGYRSKPPKGGRPESSGWTGRWRKFLQPLTPSTREGTTEDFNDSEEPDDIEPVGEPWPPPARPKLVPPPYVPPQLTDEERARAKARYDEVMRVINESRAKSGPPLAAGAEDIPW